MSKEYFGMNKKELLENIRKDYPPNKYRVKLCYYLLEILHTDL